MTTPVPLPQFNANDTSATLVAWLAERGQQVAKGQPIASFETTKALFDAEAPESGFLAPLFPVGAKVPVGTIYASVATTIEECSAVAAPPAASQAAEAQPAAEASTSSRTVTRPARELMAQHAITLGDLPPDLKLVRASDVAKLLTAGTGSARVPPEEPAFSEEEYVKLQGLLDSLRGRMRARFDRHVPLGTLLHDRWALARQIDAGEQSSIYDECLILGDVHLGRNCWVGPFTVLDGSGGGVEIGDWTSIGTGCHVYTHHTIDRVLTGGQAPTFHAPTRIGMCCFIAPNAIIGPGTELGDHSFVTAGSYVEGIFPAGSILAGSPAARIGRVEVTDGRVVRHFDREITRR